MKSHRIAAGGIVIKNHKILLVKYEDIPLGSYLAAPGGALLDNENIVQAIKREVLEETGIVVEPITVVMIEDLDCSNYKMCKIWMRCDYVSGEIQDTKEAKLEGIRKAGWYSQNDIRDKIVFPSIIKETQWEIILKAENKIEISETRKASF